VVALNVIPFPLIPVSILIAAVEWGPKSVRIAALSVSRQKMTFGREYTQALVKAGEPNSGLVCPGTTSSCNEFCHANFVPQCGAPLNGQEEVLAWNAGPGLDAASIVRGEEAGQRPERCSSPAGNAYDYHTGVFVFVFVALGRPLSGLAAAAIESYV